MGGGRGRGWGEGGAASHPDRHTLTLSVNERPVSPPITRCLVSDRNVSSVVVAQGDVMLILKPMVLRDSVAAIPCLQKDLDFLRSQGRERENKERTGSHSPQDGCCMM